VSGVGAGVGSGSTGVGLSVVVTTGAVVPGPEVVSGASGSPVVGCSAVFSGCFGAELGVISGALSTVVISAPAGVTPPSTWSLGRPARLTTPISAAVTTPTSAAGAY